ncbi:MAG: hypothetical protein N4A72_16535 [Bacteroidales bacterium]|jgi:hypothetical protein|nr:hypothetical protein [Bacteroidales bacterium]
MKKILLALSLALLSLTLVAQTGKRAYANEDLTIKFDLGSGYSYAKTTILECSVPGAVSNSSNGEVYIPRTSFNTGNGFTLVKLRVSFRLYNSNGDVYAGGSKTITNLYLYNCPMVMQNMRLTTIGNILLWVYHNPDDHISEL